MPSIGWRRNGERGAEGNGGRAREYRDGAWRSEKRIIVGSKLGAEEPKVGSGGGCRGKTAKGGESRSG